MTKQTIELDADLPHGYEAVGFRRARAGEVYLSSVGDAQEAGYNHNLPKLILRKVEPRRIVLEEAIGATEIHYGEFFSNKHTPYDTLLWVSDSSNISGEADFIVWRVVDE